MEQIGLVTGREPYFPHNQAVVIGRKTAENGIGAALSFFTEFYECRGSVPLFVAQGNAEELLREIGQNGSISARELSSLSESGRQSGCAVYAEVFTAAQCLTDGERDFCVPVLAMERTSTEESRIVLDGTALFSGEKMTAQLNERQTQGVLLAAGNAKNMTLRLTVPASGKNGELQAQVAVENLKTTVRCSAEGSRAAIALQITCDASPAEWDFAAKTNPDTAMIESLRAVCEQELLQRTQEAIRICAVKNSADPFGFGRYLAQQSPGWWREHRDRWRQLLPGSTFTVSVSCNLRAGGMQPSGEKGKT